MFLELWKRLPDRQNIDDVLNNMDSLYGGLGASVNSYISIKTAVEEAMSFHRTNTAAKSVYLVLNYNDRITWPLAKESEFRRQPYKPNILSAYKWAYSNTFKDLDKTIKSIFGSHKDYSKLNISYQGALAISAAWLLIYAGRAMFHSIKQVHYWYGLNQGQDAKPELGNVLITASKFEMWLRFMVTGFNFVKELKMASTTRLTRHNQEMLFSDLDSRVKKLVASGTTPSFRRGKMGDNLNTVYTKEQLATLKEYDEQITDMYGDILYNQKMTMETVGTDVHDAVLQVKDAKLNAFRHLVRKSESVGRKML